MKNNFSNKKPSRRQFLAGAAALGAGSAAATSASSNGDPLITEVQDWAQSTGDGVDATPY
ncbi:MAG: twin-arginine translocation signal domain-containing protein, partial [Paracoccaceae bacterium]